MTSKHLGSPPKISIDTLNVKEWIYYCRQRNMLLRDFKANQLRNF